MNIRMGRTQASAFDMYVTEVADLIGDEPADELDEDFIAVAAMRRGDTLHVPNGMVNMVANVLHEAANGADDDHDDEYRDALTALAHRSRQT